MTTQTTTQHDITHWVALHLAAQAKEDACVVMKAEAIIEKGQVVAAALAEGHTQRDYAASLGISQGQVAQLSVIGADARLINAVNQLPDSWGALYQCTQLSDPLLAMVTPRMTRAQIVALRAPPPAKPTQAPPPPIPASANGTASPVVTPPPKPNRRYSGYRVAVEEGALSSPTGESSRALRDRLAAENGINIKDPAQEAALRAACRRIYAEKHPEEADAKIRAARDTLSESSKVKLDKVIAKAEAVVDAVMERRKAVLQDSFDEHVAAEVEARIAPQLAAEREQIEAERKKAKATYAEGLKMVGEFTSRRKAIKLALTEEKLRFVLNCLHPDRAPEDRKERFGKAFSIVMELEPFIEKVQQL